MLSCGSFNLNRVVVLLSGAMIYSRHVALSFLALSGLGIGIGIVILATISTRASFQEKKKERALSSETKTKTKTKIEGTDRISQLPDDLLISIIKDLPTKDVVQTSILSKRWRNLYKFVSHINLDCLNIFGSSPYDHNCCRLQKRFIKEVDKFLSLYSMISSCRLTCCFTKSYPNKVDEWIRSLGRLGIEQLSLTFKCSPLASDDSNEKRPEFSSQLIHEAQSLQYLSLTMCTLQPNLKSQCNSLKTLRLTKVSIDSVAMESIMANCLNLESLVMEWCALSSKLCVRHLQLKELRVLGCSHLEEIELHAGNLTRFEYSASTLGQLYFNHVPLLEFFDVKLCGGILMQFLFGELAKLKSSVFKTEHSQELSVMNMFSNLRRLDLQYFRLPEQLSDATVLDLCPLLEELNIMSTHASTSQKKARVLDEKQVKKRSVNFHPNLKKFGFSGFSGATSEIEFAIYILRSAVALDQMYVRCYYRHYVVNRHWRNRELPWTKDRIKIMRQLFQGHAISNSAKIILSLPRFKFILEN